MILLLKWFENFKANEYIAVDKRLVGMGGMEKRKPISKVNIKNYEGSEVLSCL